MSIMPKKIWLVKKDSNSTGSSAKFQHESLESANAEAMRLASQNPGILFYVCESKFYFINEKGEL
ncbi:hypothetical protein UFOVP683_32 [uncultured Caudovirales phage]|uniref:Uncharacterized protein n=1 Tax=uncultured Caudovirales phage TaxID=2100421 RepID=A0A6J5NF87_9CAUD|nr:hypothetical protein UFOVP683_32 [uncultured Caudovirales phage]